MSAALLSTESVEPEDVEVVWEDVDEIAASPSRTSATSAPHGEALVDVPVPRRTTKGAAPSSWETAGKERAAVAWRQLSSRLAGMAPAATPGGVPSLKFIVVGDSATGKTSLILRHMKNAFSPTYIQTAGVDVKMKTLTVPVPGEAAPLAVKTQVWDTPGGPLFKAAVTSFMNGAHGIIVVFDVTKRPSFDSVGAWVADARRRGDKRATILLVGTRCDEDRRAVSMEDATLRAAQLGLHYIETSARRSTRVDDVFEELAHRIINPPARPAGAGICCCPAWPWR